MRWHSRHSTWPIVHRIPDRLLGLVSVTSPPRFVSSANWVTMPSVLACDLVCHLALFWKQDIKKLSGWFFFLGSCLIAAKNWNDRPVFSSNRQDLLHKQQAVHSLAWEWTNNPPEGVALSQFGFPLLYPFVSSLEQVPMQNRGLYQHSSDWLCPAPIREQGVFSHLRVLLWSVASSFIS